MVETVDVLDMGTLNELREMLEEGLDELLDEYISDTPRLLAELRDAVAAGDVAAITAVAHTLKGSSGNLGVSQLAALCGALEKEGRSGAIADAGASLAAIEAGYMRAQQALEAYKQG